MKNILTLLTTILIMGNLQAQTSSETLVKEWQRAKAYTKEYLDAMPENGYSLKPTKEMRTFSGQVLHLSDAIYGFVASATDEKQPDHRSCLGLQASHPCNEQPPSLNQTV